MGCCGGGSEEPTGGVTIQKAAAGGTPQQKHFALLEVEDFTNHVVSPSGDPEKKYTMAHMRNTEENVLKVVGGEIMSRDNKVLFRVIENEVTKDESGRNGVSDIHIADAESGNVIIKMQVPIRMVKFKHNTETEEVAREGKVWGPRPTFPDQKAAEDGLYPWGKFVVKQIPNHLDYTYHWKHPLAGELLRYRPKTAGGHMYFPGFGPQLKAAAMVEHLDYEGPKFAGLVTVTKGMDPLIAICLANAFRGDWAYP